MTCKCDKCGKEFQLTADTEKKEGSERSTYLGIRSCDSGGIYAVEVECPWCEHTHDLHH